MAIIDIYEDEGKDKRPSTHTTSSTQMAPLPPTGYVPSPAETGAAAATNAVTLGLAPRIGAYGTAALGKVAPDMFGSGTVAERLADINAVNRTGAEQNPVANVAGSLVGAAAMSPILGPTSIPMQIGRGAALGGLNALGSSENTGSDLAGDVVSGAALSGAVNAALPALGTTFSTIKNAIRGKDSEKRLGEALVDYARQPMPPTKYQTAPGAGKAAWQELNDPANRLPSDLTTHYGRGVDPSKVYEALIKDYPKIASEKTLREVVAQHNAQVPSAMMKVGKGAVAGATTGAVGGYLASGDPETALKTALGGAVTGGLGSAAASIRGRDARLVDPTARPEPSTKFGSTAREIANQAAAREIADAQSMPTSPFGKISDYISAAQTRGNAPPPEVVRIADALLLEKDPDEKRRLSMELQKYQEGRNASNTDAQGKK